MMLSEISSDGYDKARALWYEMTLNYRMIMERYSNRTEWLVV